MGLTNVNTIVMRDKSIAFIALALSKPHDAGGFQGNTNLYMIGIESNINPSYSKSAAVYLIR